MPKIRTLESNQDAHAALSQSHSDILKLVSQLAEMERELHYYKRQTESFDQVYLDMLQQAEELAAKDFQSSHNKGKRGIVIGPTDGQFKYTLRALENAVRIRNIIPQDSDMKLAIITSKEHLRILSGCKEHAASWNEPLTHKVCRLWANGTLFDDVILNKKPVWTNNFHVTDRLGSRYIMISIGGSLLAPYKQSLMLDSDSHPCPGFLKLFAILEPYSEKLWSLPSTARVDLVTAHEQFPWQGSKSFWRNLLGKGAGAHYDFQHFADRNCGTLLYNFESELTHTFAHFLQLVAAHVINNVASHKHLVMGEQTLFKIALYIFTRLRPTFHEEQFPSHVVCRSYPGREEHGGIDGFQNGMYPIQQDGKPCRECRCTPCLINHNHGAHFVTLKGGKSGWEEGIEFVGVNASNSESYA